MRDMLSKAINYDDAVEYLSEIPLLAPCYYILAGSKPGQVTRIFLYIISTLLIDRASLLHDHVQTLLISKHSIKIINGFLFKQIMIIGKNNLPSMIV
jgi:hypothetical protein